MELLLYTDAAQHSQCAFDIVYCIIEIGSDRGSGLHGEMVNRMLNCASMGGRSAGIIF